MTGSAGSASAAGSTGSAPAAGAKSAKPAPADHRKENKAVVRRYLLDVLGGAHPDEVADLVSKTYVDRTPLAIEGRGPDVVRKSQIKIHEVFAKVEYLVQELIAEDDRVVARYVVQATPRIRGGALPAQPVVINGITIFKLAGGKIQETWIMNDQLNMLRQLGFTVTPLPPEAPAASGAGKPPGAGPPAAPPPAKTGNPPPP